MANDTSGETFDRYLTIFLAIISIAFPIIIVIFLYVNRKRIGNDELFDQKYGVLYKDLETRKLASTIAFMPFYTFKRLWFVLLVFFLNEHKYIMMIANVYCQIAYMIYIGWSFPYFERKENLLNLINEAALVDMLYLFFYFVNPATEEK